MKHPIIQAASAGLLLAAICAHAATLSWDNGASTGNWNTTDANWTGSTWNNGTPDSALFSNINGNVALTQAITAGTLSFHGGGWQSGARQLALSGSTLSLGSISVNGFANGGNVDSIVDAYGQRLAINGMTVNASGNVTVRRGMFYTYNGAVVNVSGGINSTDAWNVFRMDSGSVTAAAGVDFSVIASQVEILGGTLTTPFIKVGNAAFAGTGGLSMSGGATVVATQNNSDFIQVYNNGDTGNRAAAWVGTGGVTLNTSTFNVTVATQLNGDGALTKSGGGTLTLTAANTFTGGTTVNAGTLQLQANSGNGNLLGTLTVNSGGTVVTTGDGTGLGYNAQRLGTLNINGGTVTSAGIMHVWSMGGGVNMQGGTLQSNNGVSTTSGSQLEWGNTQLNTSGNATATIAGRINIRTDAATNFRANVADGTSATDLLVTAAITQSSSSGVLAKLGGGTMEITSTGNAVGQISAAGGNLVLSGSSTFAADNVYIADSGVSGGGSGSLTIQDSATLTVAGNFMAGNWNNTVGAIHQYGGTVNLNGGGSSIRLGHWPNGGGQGGYYYLSGGTVNMPNTSMYVGWDGYGQMNISGGTFNAYGITSRYGWSWGDVIITGGTLNVGAGGLTAAPWFHLDGGTIRATAPFTMDAITVLMNGTTFDTNGNNV
ncbi:MAG: autotransporter-associated beta strand repeat-containing protein, partial [Kiritimatiellia bacterium]